MSFSTMESLAERRINPSHTHLQQLEARWEESQRPSEEQENYSS